MRLFIAEKPSVARAIAAQTPESAEKHGYISSPMCTITWCFGHMLEQAEPDTYTPVDAPKNATGKKLWRVEDLPITPVEWLLLPKEEAASQLKTIGRLLSKATEVVHAGDPDREGQLLVDEVLEHFSFNGPVLRFWVSAQDKTSIRRGLRNLKPNAEFRGLSEAARARQRADWLIGMNLSRAYTLAAKRGGSDCLLPVGRVQTPTLALVVARDVAISVFKPTAHHLIEAKFAHANGAFLGRWIPRDTQAGLDEEGRLIELNAAKDIVQQISQDGTGRVQSREFKLHKRSAPLGLSLADVTVVANKRFGYSAEETLNTCQSLYETHKLTTYPRSDCRYLPESQHSDAPATLAALAHNLPELEALIGSVDAEVRSKAWDDKKVTAHHAIIPTAQAGGCSKLKPAEQNVFELIARRYIAQFLPPEHSEHTHLVVTIAGHTFESSGKVVTSQGWTVAEPSSSKNHDVQNDEQTLPLIGEGDSVTCHDTLVRDATTTPPRPFTEGSLIRAMEQVHKFVEDPQHRRVLKDEDGIGTSATRASILSDLKRRKLLDTRKKNLVTTRLGRDLIRSLPGSVTSPVLTALQERNLTKVEAGQKSLADFVEQQVSYVRDCVERAAASRLSLGTAQVATEQHLCPTCGATLTRRNSKKGKRHWWGCTTFPSCKAQFKDFKGRPTLADYTRASAQ